MLRKSLITAAVMLLLTPALACAGLVYVNVATGSATGSATPSGSLGYKSTTVPVTITAKDGYTLDYVRNGAKVAVSGTGPWSYTIPTSGSTQYVYVYFKKAATSYPTELTAVMPAALSASQGVAFTLSGQQSTIKYLPPGTTAHFKFTSTNGTTTFSPAEGDVTSASGVVSIAMASGADTVTLVLTGNGVTSNTASVAIGVQGPGVTTSTECLTCHVGWTATTQYAASVHAASVSPIVACQSCHSIGSHPQSAQCASCHSSIAGHSAAASSCSLCHNPHSASTTHPSSLDCATCHTTATSAAPHYGGQAFVKAQYVSGASLPVSCSNCHGNQLINSANQAILAQYTSSAHGSPLAEAWRHYDWRSGTRAACQRCHAGTAFVAKLGNENNTTNAYQPGDILKPGEVLNCSVCHTDPDSGALRTASQSFTINLSNGATVTYDVAGSSTLCARCHGGRETGDSIKLDPSTTGIRGFINSHYLAAAGTLYNNAGYEYAGQVYDSLGGHKLLGSASQGPCVTCHMSGKNHTFKAAACGTCHTGANAVDASAMKALFDANLNSLKLALEAKGIYYAPVHPYFYTAPYVTGGPNTAFTNWGGTVYGPIAWKDVMGAAFNYSLLVNEPGAYAHNYNYAMKLISDSISFLNTGTP